MHVDFLYPQPPLARTPPGELTQAAGDPSTARLGRSIVLGQARTVITGFSLIFNRFKAAPGPLKQTSGFPSSTTIQAVGKFLRTVCQPLSLQNRVILGGEATKSELGGVEQNPTQVKPSSLSKPAVTSRGPCALLAVWQQPGRAVNPHLSAGRRAGGCWLLSPRAAGTGQRRRPMWTPGWPWGTPGAPAAR